VKQIKIFFCAGLLIFLTGCGSDSKFIHPLDNSDVSPLKSKKFTVGKIFSSVDKVPQKFMFAITESLEATLKNRGILQEDPAIPSNIINIEVSYYRMRNWFNRVMFGVMAGKDGVNSIVKIVDKSTQKQVGELFVSTYNLSIFLGKNKISEMHAEEIVDALEGQGDDNS
jgi:hypothetical protein